MPIAASIMPDSSSQGRPVISPLPLNEKKPPNTRSSQILPARGMIIVTPVRATRGSSAITVAWPTSTPGTSVIALCGPVGSSPITTPKSRIRARFIGYLLSSGLRPSRSPLLTHCFGMRAGSAPRAPRCAARILSADASGPPSRSPLLARSHLQVMLSRTIPALASLPLCSIGAAATVRAHHRMPIHIRCAVHCAGDAGAGRPLPPPAQGSARQRTRRRPRRASASQVRTPAAARVGQLRRAEHTAPPPAQAISYPRRRGATTNVGGAAPPPADTFSSAVAAIRVRQPIAWSPYTHGSEST